MSVIVGIGGASKNTAAALCDAGQILAVCEQERITRTRRDALQPRQLPLEALDTILGLANRVKGDVSCYAVAERTIELPPNVRIERFEHHHGHAATSFYTSPFPDAVVLVCDSQGDCEVTVWEGHERELERRDFPWSGPGFATVYSRAAEALGYASATREHQLETLAHAGRHCGDAVDGLIAYRDDHLEVSPHLAASVAARIDANGDGRGIPRAADVASGIQRRLGDLLVEAVSRVKQAVGGRNLCLGGGLFFNSSLCTRVAESGLYERTFVPVNPGNAGVSVGAAIAAVGTRPITCGEPLSSFLGPEYSSEEIKATLDNCKLCYQLPGDDQLIDETASALKSGGLVGWFQGRMEWGPRALGNRSILASPLGPYVLENLNRFLKHRQPYQSYGVAVCADDAPRYFKGPETSERMEFEYDVLDPDLFRSLMPLAATTLRVQTVPESAGIFYRLLKAFGDLTGIPVLVNTSFNGFQEPIVCTPRDAIRVFYGTGLDRAVIGRWVLRK